MRSRPFRLHVAHDGPPVGRLVDRSRILEFTFDGTPYRGFAGDTLASALLANGVRVVARSFKFHRPRGVFSAGVEEPNALVTLLGDGRETANQRATTVELFDGLAARSQNSWPSLENDLGAVADRAGRLLPAGFYYKTFMWPAALWPFFERQIRRAAGIGPAPRQADADAYEHIHVECDVLVAGGGAAGLAAASAAAAAGARVILAEQSPRLGGLSDLDDGEIEGAPALGWLVARAGELASSERVQLLTRTTVAGLYAQGYALLAERVTDHAPGVASTQGAPRERIWKVRARSIVVACGAVERSMAFADNDRPGVMQCDALRAYLVRHAVATGRIGVIYANNDAGLRTALALKAAGIAIAAVIDRRGSTGGALPAALAAAGIEHLAGQEIAGLKAARRGRDVAAVETTGTGSGAGRRIACDFVGVAGGWTPQLHLYAQGGGKLAWSAAIAAPVPAPGPTSGATPVVAVGAARGLFSLADCVADGRAQGGEAARAAIAGTRQVHAGALGPQPAPDATSGDFDLPAPDPSSRAAARCFIDLANDVTVADIALAVREGYDSPEHLKRYTTLGMGPDQGKTGNAAGAVVHAAAAGTPIADLAATTFRPPYTPVTFGAIAGMRAGSLFLPVRRSPVWAWQRLHGADFEPVAGWHRPYCYRTGQEPREDAVAAEVRGVRAGVGLFDASSLGKIEIAGPDAAAFLDLMSCTDIANLAVGQCRYVLFLNEDGFLFEDGVVARLAADRFVLHSSSSGAEHMAHWLEFWLQTEWPALKAFIVPVTERWAQFALAGPLAREVVGSLASEIRFTREALGPMECVEGRFLGASARVFRISYTGELSFEIACPANVAGAVWNALIAAGERYGIVPFGTEALHVLRAEKGYIAIGDETDGTVTPHDLGLGWAVSRRKADFVGRLGLARPNLARPDRPQLVGLRAEARHHLLAGTYLIDSADRDRDPPHRTIGHVTSAYDSPTLGRPIALALVEGGRARHGEVIVAPIGRDHIEVEIVSPAFFDNQGVRANG